MNIAASFDVNLFVVQSKNAKSESERRSITLFKNFEMIREYHPS
jgi:hypothetical protein